MCVTYMLTEQRLTEYGLTVALDIGVTDEYIPGGGENVKGIRHPGSDTADRWV